ncbi:hypothetical protein FBULB1_5925 [Fusarium bulbicola]|nr:hypothetical protein FBULB1_5925 [Fusarium bulbicola]
MEEDALSPHESAACAEEETVESVPGVVKQYDLNQLPIGETVWHPQIMKRNTKDSPLFKWNMPSVYTVGPLPNGDFVVVITSRIREIFKNIFRDYILREAEAGDSIFLDIFAPSEDDIKTHGQEAAERKTRHDILEIAVDNIVCRGRPLYDFYKKIIHVTSDQLPLEWALLCHHLEESEMEPEVRDQLTLLSLLLELHFVEDLNSDNISQLFEKTQPDGWEEYSISRACELISVVQNTDLEIHEISLFSSLLEFSGRKAGVPYDQHDLPEISHQQEERTIPNSCRILGSVLRQVLMAGDEGEMRSDIIESSGLDQFRKRFSYSNHQISELRSEFLAFLLFGSPIPKAKPNQGRKRKAPPDPLG